MKSDLAPHPRLYIGSEQQARLRRAPTVPFLKQATEIVAKQADFFVNMPPLSYRPERHNALLTRAREVQTRIVTLLIRWQQTGDTHYRQSILKYIHMMKDWEYWSWIAMRAGDSAPDAIFDLSYGENCATLALAYDWLYATLDASERALFFATAHRPIEAGLIHAKEGGAWWFGKPDSNWNTVCAGGLGMLALAMGDDLSSALQFIEQADVSISPYMHFLDNTQGAWPEGVGYWNYGMRYAFMYLLSNERATGTSHSLMALAGTVQTLSFPLDFTPNGQSCSFGDVNNWAPLPFHYAVAERLGCSSVTSALDAWLSKQGFSNDTWPNAAEWLCLHPGTLTRDEEQHQNAHSVKLYQGLDWAVMTDRRSESVVTATIRGGTTQVPHSHRDLLSFHMVVGDEKLISNLGPSEYLDSTFSPRRDEIFEMTPASKNTILINGVGITVGSQLDSTTLVQSSAGEGVRLEATTAMGEMRDGPAVSFCGRLFVLLDTGSILMVDRVNQTHFGRVESRLHTQVSVKTGNNQVILNGKQHTLNIAYASSVPSSLYTATTSPTTPSAPAATVLRWCTDQLARGVTMVTLLSVRDMSAVVRLDEMDDLLTVTVYESNRESEVRLTLDLYPA